jgi:putative tryptophan/tyrosine transport system substrate-binding protein
MRRREVIRTLGGAVVAWPLAAHAQQSKLPIIGFLGTGLPATWGQWVAAFVQRLRELGRIEGRTVAIEYRWAAGRSERFAEIAAEFVRLKVDVIVAVGTAALVAKQATSVIPIVFPISADPLGVGLVASLARPGGNVTGLSLQQSELTAKRLGLLQELIPGFRRLGIIANVGNPAIVWEVRSVQETARTLGLAVVSVDIQKAEDIAPAFAALRGSAQAVYVVGDPLMVDNQVLINTSAIGTRLPTIHAFREFVASGGLLSYGANFSDLFRRAADYVDKILRGAKPADLPVEQPTSFDLVINLKTAVAIGLAIPPFLLHRANEVIE